MQHYTIVHLSKEIIERCGKEIGQCPLCDKMFKFKHSFLTHMGVTHRLVEDLIEPQHPNAERTKDLPETERGILDNSPKGKPDTSSMTPRESFLEFKQKSVPICSDSNLSSFSEGFSIINPAMKAAKNQDRITCSLCPKTFLSRSSLMQHYNIVHFTKEIIERCGKDVGQCPLCGKMFILKISFLIHMGVTHRLVEDLIEPLHPNVERTKDLPETERGSLDTSPKGKPDTALSGEGVKFNNEVDPKTCLNVKPSDQSPVENDAKNEDKINPGDASNEPHGDDFSNSVEKG
jgi:uncharacterized C2H2 Zn-finger protein